MKEGLKHFALESGRMLVMAVASYLATDLVIKQLVDLCCATNLSPAVQLQIVGVLTVIAKSVDRSLHETGTAEKGLVRF